MNPFERSRINFYFLFVIFLTSCQLGPKDEEIVKLISNNGFVIKKYIILNKGNSYKIDDFRVFPVKVMKKYIWPGLTYGYEAECPKGQCCRDEYIIETCDYLLRRNHWKEWEIYENKQINKNVVNIIWRPSSIAQNVFYKDFFKKEEIPKNPNSAPNVKF